MSFGQYLSTFPSTTDSLHEQFLLQQGLRRGRKGPPGPGGGWWTWDSKGGRSWSEAWVSGAGRGRRWGSGREAHLPRGPWCRCPSAGERFPLWDWEVSVHIELFWFCEVIFIGYVILFLFSCEVINKGMWDYIYCSCAILFGVYLRLYLLYDFYYSRKVIACVQREASNSCEGKK